MRHRRRGDAGPLGRRPRDRRRAGHAGDPEGVPRHGARRERPLGAVARARAEHDPRVSEHDHRSASRLSAPWIDERDEELVLEVLRSGWLSLGPTGPRFEELLADAVGAPHCAAVSSGTAGLHLCMRLAGVGPGDEVITSPYSFVASANCAIYEGATPVFADIDPQHAQPRPGGRRGGDHAADEGDRRGRHLRLPVRARRAARDLRPARARARRGRVRGARRALQGPAARLARPSGDLGLLPEQADHDRRGRRGHDRLRGRARAARLAAQPGPARDLELAPARPPRLQLPPRRHLGRARHRPAREARPDPRGAPRGRRALRRAARRRRRRAAARRRRRPRPLVVRLRREAARAASTATA